MGLFDTLKNYHPSVIAGRALFGRTDGNEKAGRSFEPQLMEQYGRLNNPNYGLDQAQRIASSGPTLADFLGIQAASGGSSAIAREQFQSGRQQSMAQGFDAWRGLESERMNGMTSLLGLMNDRDSLKWQGGQNARDRQASFFDSIFKIAGNKAFGGGGAG